MATLDVYATRSLNRDVLRGTDVQKSRTWEVGLEYKDTDALFGVATSGKYTKFKMRGIESEARYTLEQGYYGQAAVSLNDHSELFFAPAGTSKWRDFFYTPANSATVTLDTTWGNAWDASWTLRAAHGIMLDRSTIGEKGGWGVHDLALRYAPQDGDLAGLNVDFGIENIFDRQSGHAAKGWAQYQADRGQNLLTRRPILMRPAL